MTYLVIGYHLDLIKDIAHPILITIGLLRGTGGVRSARPEVRGVALVHGVALDRGSIRAKRALLASFSKRRKA